MSLRGTDQYSPPSGIAIFGRFRTPSGRFSDIALDAQRLAKTISQLPAEGSLDQLLSLAATAAAHRCPPKSRPIAIVGIGFGPPDTGWWKGDFDPSKHPRWPAKAPESQGGRFRIREDGGKLTGDNVHRAVRRLALRRALRKVFTAALRIGGEAALGPIGDVIAIVDTIRTIVELRKLAIEATAAREFVAKAPYSLDDLRVSAELESFPSHDAFVKDLASIAEWLLKRFGPAGDGYDYHHIVEQGGENSEKIPAEQLHNTDNIIRIPRLVHEAINSYMYNSYMYKKKDGTGMTYREWLPKQPYSVQRATGIEIMRDLGIIR
ncbi:MAG TPA: hypothetical protein VF930_11905 [Stellaceae bacterium]